MDIWTPGLDGRPTPDQRWNTYPPLLKALPRPLHARTISRQMYDELPDPTDAFLEPKLMEMATDVRRGRKRKATENYEANLEKDHRFRQNLLSKAIRSGLAQDRMRVITDGGGTWKSTLTLLPVEEIVACQPYQKHLERMWPNHYPMKKLKERTKDAKPLIPDNYNISMGRPLQYPSIPNQAVAPEMSLDDIFDFSKYEEDDGPADKEMEDAAMDTEEEGSSAGESMKDSVVGQQSQEPREEG
ncbi:hypothetical protein PRZ48_014814 [Zasmidium cellare]|uniref:Uncharacterized protein n=1 Tax=Zasmidium cellare TaxID=395010 RepID=A0ABR0DZZ5_ZASCE|nr:hypothetical protein PRZ48_014814 [Zasmidium cellare]